MKVEFINPFIESVYEMCSTMLNVESKREELTISRGGPNPRDITAIIGMSGPARGIVALSFPIKTALSMVSTMLGMETKLVVVDETVQDGIAELVNVVAGGAKARFSSEVASERPIQLSLPTIIKGDGYDVAYPTSATWIEVPFSSDLGNFSLRVIFAFEK